MSEPIIEQENIKLPFWKAKGESPALVKLFSAWWALVQTWLSFALNQKKALTATMEIVDLLAFERGIVRLTNEPEELYRKRVHFALANAKDAGSSAGFERIWERLGLGTVSQNERVDPVNWDVIELVVTDSIVSENAPLLNEIIRLYGRTCRRYQYSTITPISIEVQSFSFDLVSTYSEVS